MQSECARIPRSGARPLDSTIIFCVAFLICVGYTIAAGRLGQSPREGYREYIMAGARLVSHGELRSSFILDDGRAGVSTLLPPLYSVIVGGTYALLGVESFASTLFLHLLNAVAVGAIAWFAFVIAREAAGSKAGWAAGAVCAVNPAIFGYSTFIWDTCLFALATIATVRIVQRMADSGPKVIRFLLLGVWLGVVALLNPALTVAYPLLVLYPLWRSSPRDWRAIAVCVAASAAGWMVAVAPWTIRNYGETGKLMYVRGGFGFELWLGVCPEADSGGRTVYEGQFPLNNRDVQDEVAAMGEEAFIADRTTRAWRAIGSDPARFAGLIGRRIVDYWTGSTLSHAGTDGAIPRSRGRRAVMLFLSAELSVLTAGLILRGRPRRSAAWLSAIVVLFSIVYCVTHVQVRFRTPTEPLLAVVLSLLVFGGSCHNERNRRPSLFVLQGDLSSRRTISVAGCIIARVSILTVPDRRIVFGRGGFMGSQIIRIDPTGHDRNAVQAAAKALNAGGLVVFPTETVYGVAASVDSPRALARLRDLKSLGPDRALTVHIADRDDARNYAASPSGIAERLMRKGWPGPLTLIVQADDPSSAPVMTGRNGSAARAIYHDGTVGLRCPDDDVARALLRSCDGPVVASSAQANGHSGARTIDELSPGVRDSAELILDAGPVRFGRPSTVVRVLGDRYELIREGVLDAGIIERLSMLRILFVCTGNTCRSPMAAGLAKKILAERLGCRPDELAGRGVVVMSAGTSGGIGGASSGAIAAMGRRAIDLSSHFSTMLTAELIQQSDHVFAMTRAHRSGILSLSPSAEGKVKLLLDHEDVQDPLGGSEDEYERCAETIERGLRARLHEVAI